VFSDVHLGVTPPSVERDLLAFLDSLRNGAGSLIVNGDLFDFWFEWRHVIPRVGFRVIAALASLHDAGVPVLWIGGNHDCWGGEVLRTDAGVDYQLGAWNGQIGPWRSHIEHGDGLRPVEDRRYRALRRVLRSPAAISAFRWLHPDWASRLALGSSGASRTHGPRDGGSGLRRIGLELLAERADVDLVIFGHSHVATLERAPGGGIFANPGSWLDAPTYLRIDANRVELRRWTGSAEGECLHSLDRRAEEALPNA
jgi:UDP-2,3-diacylglucosamine hydrolase